MQNLALSLALFAFLFAVSIHIVMPNAALVALRVLASEITVQLIVLGLAASGLALFVLITHDSTSLIARAALVLATLALVLAIIPLARAHSVIADADQQLRAAFGPEVVGGRPAFSLATSLTGLRVPDVTVDKDIPFEIADGTLLLDRYSLTGSTQSRPAMVVVHGGSWRAGDKGQGIASATEWSRYFAANGYVVYDVQYRLAPRAQHPQQMNDVLCALAHVRSHATEDRVDPQRVILVGRSAGAHLALLAAYRQRESPCGSTAAVAGVVALYGPTDLIAGYANPGNPAVIDGRSVLRDFLGGAPDEVGDNYQDAMPRNWLAGAVPTLLLHGDADQVVFPYHSADLALHLREASLPVVHLRFPWSGHGFDAISIGVGGQIALWVVERFAAASIRTSMAR